MVQECLLPSLIQACWNLLKMCDSCISWPTPAMYKSWMRFRTEAIGRIQRQQWGGVLCFGAYFCSSSQHFFSVVVVVANVGGESIQPL